MSSTIVALIGSPPGSRYSWGGICRRTERVVSLLVKTSTLLDHRPLSCDVGEAQASELEDYV